MSSVLIAYKKHKSTKDDGFSGDFIIGRKDDKTKDNKIFKFKLSTIQIVIPVNLRHKFKLYHNSKYIIALSGLIHNEKTILKNFKKKGISQALINGYQKGSIQFKKLLSATTGQFAVFIYDIKNDKITIVNDKLGLFGVYYFENKNLFLYSNSAEVLISNIDKPKKINSDAISDYLTLGIVQNRETFIDDVRNLNEGSVLTKTSKNRYEIKQYFKFQFDDPLYSRKKYLPLINDILKKTVNNLYDYSVGPKAVCLTAGFDTRLINSILLESERKHLAAFTRFPIREESEINRFAIPMDEKIGRKFASKHKLDYILFGKGAKKNQFDGKKFTLINGLFGGELFGAEAYNQPATLFRVKIPSTGKTHFLTPRFKNLLSRDSIETYYMNISKIECEEWEKKVFIYKAGLLATTFFNNLEDYGGQDWQFPNKLFRESTFLGADTVLYPFTDTDFLEQMFKIPFRELDHHIFYKSLLEKYYSKYLKTDILHCKKRYYKFNSKTKKLFVFKKVEDEMRRLKGENVFDDAIRRKNGMRDFLDLLNNPLNLNNLDKSLFFRKKVIVDEKDLLYHRVQNLQEWFKLYM